MTESTEPAGRPDGPHLTQEEDDGLRRLKFLATYGELSQLSKERLLELRLRDRREEVRLPRELGSSVDPEAVDRGEETGP